MAKKFSVANRKPGPHERTEYPLYETMYVLCPTARYVGGTSMYLCECAHPPECLGVRAAHRQRRLEQDAGAKNQPLIIHNTLHIEDHNGTLVLYGRCLRGDYLRLGDVKPGTQPRVQQKELAEVFDFKLIERPDFMDALIARMREKYPRDLKWEVKPALIRRLTPRAPRDLGYGEVLQSEDLVLGDTSRILDFGGGPYRLCQDSQDVYDVLQGIGQPELMAEYDGLFVRENEDEDMSPAEVRGFNRTPRHGKQAELIYMARLDARPPGNVPSSPVALEALPRVGPFMGVTADRVKELGDGRKFRCVAYAAHNAQGLINRQPGVAILDQATRQVVCDQINYGCGPAQGVAFLAVMSDQNFVKFVNEHPRHRYQI